MTKLNDTQAVLLAQAAQRESGSLYPLPASLSAASGGVEKGIAALLKHGLAEEKETRDTAAAHRTCEDVRYGIFVTAAGLAAINIVPDGEEPSASTLAKVEAPKIPRSNKSEVVVDLLSRPDGATLDELVQATGWLPHSTRAALTGLRKKGMTIERSKRDDATCYRKVDAA